MSPNIVERHPELDEILPELVAEMQEAYEVMPARDPDEEWHYLKKHLLETEGSVHVTMPLRRVRPKPSSLEADELAPVLG